MDIVSFTTVYDGLSNVLKNKVKISEVVENNSRGSINEYISIWDTGATKTVITEKVANDLNLKPVSVSRVSTPQGSYNAYMYYINLYLPNRVKIPKLLVLGGQPAGCDVLIGMDVISLGDFAVSNFEQKTTFSFRCPSVKKIDFVKNSYIEPNRKIGLQPARNSKCPCGSGKKYKNCCGKI